MTEKSLAAIEQDYTGPGQIHSDVQLLIAQIRSLQAKLEEKPGFECDICGMEYSVDDGAICQKCWTNDARANREKVLTRRTDKVDSLQAELEEEKQMHNWSGTIAEENLKRAEKAEDNAKRYKRHWNGTVKQFKAVEAQLAKIIETIEHVMGVTLEMTAPKRAIDEVESIQRELGEALSNLPDFKGKVLVDAEVVEKAEKWDRLLPALGWCLEPDELTPENVGEAVGAKEVEIDDLEAENRNLRESLKEIARLKDWFHDGGNGRDDLYKKGLALDEALSCAKAALEDKP